MKILIITTQDCFFLSHVKERANYFRSQGYVVGVAAQKTSEIFVQQINQLGFVFFDTSLERQSINPLSQIWSLILLLRIQYQFKPDISYHSALHPSAGTPDGQPLLNMYQLAMLSGNWLSPHKNTFVEAA